MIQYICELIQERRDIMSNIKDNIESAVKSFELEGFVYTNEEKAILEKVANGKLTINEGKSIFMNELTKKYGTVFSSK